MKDGTVHQVSTISAKLSWSIISSLCPKVVFQSPQSIMSKSNWSVVTSAADKCNIYLTFDLTQGDRK